MERVAKDVRKFALEFYQQMPLEYHVQKFLVFKLASLGSYFPSRIGQSIIFSPFGSPIGRLLHRNFCGGESLEEALSCATNYKTLKIGTMLDLVGEPSADDLTFKSDITKCLPIIPSSQDLMYSVKLSALFGPKKLATISKALLNCKDCIELLSKNDAESTFAAILKHMEEIRDRHSYRVAVDAEWSDIQPAISAIAFMLMEKLNDKGPFLLNTYQAYLKNSLSHFQEHVERSKKSDFHLGAKIVRGAYLSHEIRSESGSVFEDISHTHRSFDNIIEHAVNQQLAPSSVILASHNEDSVAKAVLLKEDTDDKSIMFAQLHGMRDYITFYLASRNFPVYKYVPYGTFHEAIPYLVRRAEENAGFFDTLKYEKELISSQLFKKLMG